VERGDVGRVARVPSPAAFDLWRGGASRPALFFRRIPHRQLESRGQQFFALQLDIAPVMENIVNDEGGRFLSCLKAIPGGESAIRERRLTNSRRCVWRSWVLPSPY